MKEKVYYAARCRVRCPAEHRASNGGRQFSVLIRTTTKKRVAEIIGTSPRYLREFCGLHVTDRPEHAAIAVKPDTVYYQVEHTAGGWVNKWFERAETKIWRPTAGDD